MRAHPVIGMGSDERVDNKGSRWDSVIIVRTLAVLGIVAGAAAFAGFPDIDIKILGIGWHRFFLTHSVFIPFVLYLLYRMTYLRYKVRSFLGGVVTGSAAATGIHLITDVIPRKPVRFLFFGNLWYGSYLDDRLWIIVNALLCIWIAYRGVRKLFLVHTEQGFTKF